MEQSKLRNLYFTFFQSKGHSIIPSASLIPLNDPSVLFTTAGMHPLVPYLLGEKHPSGIRLVNIQKCLRTVDFDNIGDNTHNTFFQMLGNWSLGDYFKKEAIEWSFEFLTGKKWLNIPLKYLAVTLYEGDSQVPRDEEGYALWRSLGISEKRIAFLGKDNFWSAGETGPCGPSTEMFYWTSNDPIPERFDPNDNNWVEIWNDVFMTYNRHADGKLVPLKQKNVDTGMGFERAVAVLSKKKSAYETDLFLPIISKIERLSNAKYKDHQREMRIIADHIRAATFILGDDNAVVPSNADRGYVLRRLIRRCVRYARLLGIKTNCLAQLAQIVIDEYADFYQELKQNKERIQTELLKEEEKFAQTLDKGLREFNQISQEKKVISGKDAFLLFQSYGFPLEMTEELASEKKIKVDVKEFREEFAKHQELSRTATQGMFKGGLSDHSAATIKLHTATHLLNEALRKVISSEIHQKGSNITPERLRFDFSFQRKLTIEEVKKVEDEVNRVIQKGLDVKKVEMSYQEAIKVGAQMEFGVKYGDKVSVYFVGDYSKEFCGGPHVKNTKEIGKFKIIKEEACAAGIRRIKAVVE